MKWAKMQLTSIIDLFQLVCSIPSLYYDVANRGDLKQERFFSFLCRIQINRCLKDIYIAIETR